MKPPKWQRVSMQCAICNQKRGRQFPWEFRLYGCQRYYNDYVRRWPWQERRVSFITDGYFAHIACRRAQQVAQALK